MKRNYSLLFTLLLIHLVSSTSLYAQPSIAVSDEANNFEYSCVGITIDVLGNDTLFGDVSSYNIDLNPSQPGIQSSMQTSMGGFFNVNGMFVSYQNFGGAFPGITDIITYVLVDNLGNISNPAAISVQNMVPPIYANPVYPHCGMSDGEIQFQNIWSFSSSVNIRLFLNSVEIGQYMVPAGSQEYIISGLAAGIYEYHITLDCGLLIMNSNIALLTASPLSGQVNATYNDYNADGIVNVGDIINYQITATNTTTNCPANNISLYYFPWNQYPTASGNIASLAPGESSSALSSYLTITQENINSGTVGVTHYLQVSDPNFDKAYMYSNTPLSTSSGIKLNAFIDSNNNGTQDSGEQNYNQGTFSYAINSGALHHINTNNGVHYLYETNPANVYDLHYSIDNNYCGTQYLIAQANYSNVTVADGSGVTTYNFAITPVACQDLSVQLYNNNNPRPGFVYSNTLVIKNEGNQTASGNVSFQADPTLSLISNSVNATQSANGFTYNATNMTPGESRYITVLMQVPTIPTVSLGQTLTNTVAIANTDANAANNSASLTSIIVGSYDPNEKTEAHGGKIVHSGFTADDYLTYTIRFENTGTAEAINIRVEDVLDNQLDASSVKMIRASHNYTLDRIGTHLTWRFDGINLPPSVAGDDITGHGYVVFQVKPKAGYALGDVIPNSANIYFDFNPAIVTNTCTTEFVPFLGVDAFENGSLDYYPNPTSGLMTFSMKNASINQIEITDILGKTLLVKAVQSAHATVDLSSLKSGVYFAKLSSGAQEKTVKLVRQ